MRKRYALLVFLQKKRTADKSGSSKTCQPCEHENFICVYRIISGTASEPG